MLAYVFWHWPKSNVAAIDYIQKLRLFHSSLAANAPEGFSHSIVFEVNNPSWLKTDSVAYEDWYLLEDSASLDRLNLAAVTGNNEMPHNLVAADAADGTAGLYRLRLGEEKSLETSKFARWFSKAEGLAYADLYSRLGALTSQPGVGLWCRQMTLGPTTEFCLRSTDALDFPAGLSNDASLHKVEKIWGE